MFSLIHSKVLSRLSLLVPSVVLMCFSLTVRAELEVEWIDDNTIVVSGYGYGGVVTNDNPLGSCTNCLAISPAEMHSIKLRISELLRHLKTDAVGALSLCNGITSIINSSLEDISTFQRFGVGNSTPSLADRISFTNYINSVNNTQTTLDKSYSSLYSQAATTIRYNNGIYDYATSVVSPKLSAMLGNVNSIYDYENDIITKAYAIQDVVDGITEESCDCGGGGTNGTSCTSCPCEDQWTALLRYIMHIDDDQHDRYVQLTGISNHVSNVDISLDSYAKIVSGVLYNDSTITLDDGETWTNVYFSGWSNGYDYDKSNILQRIELILFGMAYVSTNTFSDLVNSYTDELDDDAANNVTNQFNELSSDSTNSFLSAKSRLEDKVNSIKSIQAMFVFWGTAGSDSPFTLGYVPNLDGSGGGQYIEVGEGFLGSEVSRFRQLCRYGFQLIWATSFLFLIWLFYVRLFKYVLIFLKYAFEWINEAFAS